MARVTRSKAIRAKCLDCTCGQSGEVRRCHITDCPLWRYRLGHEEKNAVIEAVFDMGGGRE